MRKALLLIALLLIVGGAIAFVVFRLTRKPTPTPVGWRAHVTTIAGDGTPRVRESNQPTQAAFSDPFGVAVAKDGTVYISDAGESNRIVAISPEGRLNIFAGGAGGEGFGDDKGGSAAFNTPSGLALDREGNLYVADTGNNSVRKVSPEGHVQTIAGDGTAGYLDGPARQARFNGPVGVAVDAKGNVFVADTYNDRIRMISPDGNVTTVAGAGTPGYADGDRNTSLFDTPCGIIAAADGTLIVADTGNDSLRKITPDGNVSTWSVSVNGEGVSSPVGLALTYDNYLYVTELDRSRVLQFAPDGSGHVIAGSGRGFSDESGAARFNEPTGVAVNAQTNDLYVADSANYFIRKLSPTPGVNNTTTPTASVQLLTNEILNQQALLWPLDPQDRPHEVVATLGEVRGSFDSNDSRHHLHSGLDVFGAYNTVVRAVRSEKVTDPLPNWGFASLNEGMRVGVISYIHMHVGRDKDAKMFDDPRFLPVNGSDGKLARVRVKRGTRFKPGDAIGTVNRMYHVHMNVGPPSAEVNPLTLSPIGFQDDKPPVIQQNGIQLFDLSGKQFSEKQKGRLLVTGQVRIVVDAFDRTNFNADRRRLGLYLLGYQVLNTDGSAAPNFSEPRITQIYDRLPPDRDATKVAYAEESGITVYGSESTKFYYEVTNLVRDGRANRDVWDTSRLPPGDYTLRIIARDYNGNEAEEGRDLLITIR
jgi:DNA-binding beta-propeller fold protein YncE